ncbi:MAG: molybdate ABC transporter substrate-binding protein [Gammaproteobacteria bacterium]|nr:molybdate ABC transporter substrate-binding protein [Gammaproteobacteria bacterium]
MKKIRLLIVLLGLCINAQAAEVLNIAVASNMSHAFTQIADIYEERSNSKIRLSVGSSGNFTRQIIQGAPYKIFLSAGTSYIDMLRKNGVSLIADVEYARGRIGFFIPHNSTLNQNNNLDGIIKKLFHGHYARLVIPNPEHAPFGLAARQALQTGGIWALNRKKLLPAENAAQATQIAISGNVDAGIIPASHALLPEVSEKGQFILIPENWHEPLQQHLVLLAGANKSESVFFDFLRKDTALKIVSHFGYTLGTEKFDGLAIP